MSKFSAAVVRRRWQRLDADFALVLGLSGELKIGAGASNDTVLVRMPRPASGHPRLTRRVGRPVPVPARTDTNQFARQRADLSPIDRSRFRMLGDGTPP